MEQNRVRTLIDALCMRPHEFAESMSITNQCLNGWMHRPITKGTALAINRLYPNVSVSWLMTGEGDMFTVPPQPKPLPNVLSKETYDILQQRIVYLERENERLLNMIERFMQKK